MSIKVKWGIIAAGGIAKRRTLPAMQFCENAEIVAAMDKSMTALEGIQKEYGIANIYLDEDEMLRNSEIEAVYVASPVCFHKEQARKVLEAGKHLLLEKPIGLTLDEAKEVKSYANHSMQKVGVGMVMKMHPGHQKIRELIKQGTLGEIVNCRVQFTCWFPDMENNWRQKAATGGGGALVDMGIHCVDLLRYLLDDEVEKVYGSVETKTFRYEVDDSADCMLHMKKGANCFVDVHFNIPSEVTKNVLEIYGTKGSVIASGTIGQDGGGSVLLTISGQGGANVIKPLEYQHENIYAKQISQFSEAILNDTQVFTTIEDAFETMCVIDALYRSAEEEKVIYIHA